ncbi:MAG: hypothetical protein LBV12_06365 [Puniceicoccales bacterium]|jgi:hypothetical protein|nr:hypothetical protein [Puniceicoccales bacterium]
MAVKWRGSTELQLQADLEMAYDQDGCTTILTYMGPYAECIARRPKRGQTIKGYPGAIQRVTVSRMTMERGKIVVTLRDDTEIEGTGDDKPSKPRFELIWVEIDKPLETHPIFNEEPKFGTETMANEAKIRTNTGNGDLDARLQKIFGSKEYVTTNGGLIQLMKSMTPYERAAVYEYMSVVTWKDFVQGFFEKWDAGIESYRLYAPVARKTTEHLVQPVPERPGKIEKPVGFSKLPKRGNGKDFKWIKTTDQFSWTGRYGRGERIEEWTGSDEIDEDLYAK